MQQTATIMAHLQQACLVANHAAATHWLQHACASAEQLDAVHLSPFQNFWSKVHDFTPAPGNWHLLPEVRVCTGLRCLTIHVASHLCSLCLHYLSAHCPCCWLNMGGHDAVIAWLLPLLSTAHF